MKMRLKKMMMMCRVSVLMAVLNVLSWSSSSSNNLVEANHQPAAPDMILILVDGFRWDYTELHKGGGLPGFDHMLSKGVRAEYLNPVFPANSFPNWHTIVTGLYPENHGIVSNYMYDPERESFFSLHDLETTKDPNWWGDVEPLWITSTKEDINTALFYWSRCDVPFEGILPKYCLPYDYAAASSQHFVKQLHQSLDMLQGEDYHLIMLYNGGVDSQGHYYGPESAEVGASVREFDAVLQGLWETLETRGMTNNTNVVIVSDHGMTGTRPQDLEFVDITTCIDHQQLHSMIGYGSYVNILPAPGFAQQVVDGIRTCEGVHDKVEVQLKDELEERYHYRTHRLIHEIIVIAKPGFNLVVRPIKDAIILPERSPSYVGDHGFDDTTNQNPDMRGILYASGPSFAEDAEAGAVEQVDVYGLICRALHLECHPHNGTMAHIEAFFKPDRSSVTSVFGTFSQTPLILLLSIFFITSFTILGRAG